MEHAWRCSGTAGFGRVTYIGCASRAFVRSQTFFLYHSPNPYHACSADFKSLWGTLLTLPPPPSPHSSFPMFSQRHQPFARPLSHRLEPRSHPTQ